MTTLHNIYNIYQVHIVMPKTGANNAHMIPLSRSFEEAAPAVASSEVAARRSLDESSSAAAGEELVTNGGVEASLGLPPSPPTPESPSSTTSTSFRNADLKY